MAKDDKKNLVDATYVRALSALAEASGGGTMYLAVMTIDYEGAFQVMLCSSRAEAEAALEAAKHEYDNQSMFSYSIEELRPGEWSSI